MDIQETQVFATFEQIAAAIAETGLVAPGEMTSVISTADGDWAKLRAQLLERGSLSAYQFDTIREGRAASLRIGNYDVLGRLGAGGMGTVLKARHRRMKRIVALKILAANLSKNQAFVMRFQREVETIARLGHPNVVMAYDADEADVGHFLVMEFVNGPDLAAIVERNGPMSVAQAVDCTMQAARGLAYAHSQEIVHRDIKPHNLMLDDNGAVKVTDLGLARLAPGAEAGAGGFDVTMAGGVIGTADYMPPEQAIDSTTIDHRADIYSLGGTLHFLLTGRPPYQGATLVAILLKHRDGEIPKLASERPECPPELDALFAHMLAKKVEDRVQTMGEVVARLEKIARTLQPDDAAPRAQVTIATLTPSASIASPSSQTVETTSVPGTLRVVVVEPSRAQASIIRGFLTEQQIEVVATAQNIAQAIDAVRTHSPNAVASAMHLADGTGLELAERIRKEGVGRAPGFILITSEAEDEETAGLSRLHRVMTLKKPFTGPQLADGLKLVSGRSATLVGDELQSASPKRRDRSALRVLIVDDSGTARIHERMTLQRLGFSKFAEAADGAQAIAAATREAFDLIVTDYNMPLMDGRALVSYLKQTPSTASTPIVMVTTETDERILAPVREMGVVAILDKAFSDAVVGPLLDRLF